MNWLRDRIREWLGSPECDGCRYEVDALDHRIKEAENGLEFLADAMAKRAISKRRKPPAKKRGRR
jgi:hypothetical protein